MEKEFINKLGFKTASFYEVSSQEDLIHAIDQIGTPSILKTRRFGYDGKGQLKLESVSQAEDIWKTSRQKI